MGHLLPLPVTRDRWFESGSLRRRVSCEPDFRGNASQGVARGYRPSFSLDHWWEVPSLQGSRGEAHLVRSGGSQSGAVRSPQTGIADSGVRARLERFLTAVGHLLPCTSENGPV